MSKRVAIWTEHFKIFHCIVRTIFVLMMRLKNLRVLAVPTSFAFAHSPDGCQFLLRISASWETFFLRRSGTSIHLFSQNKALASIGAESRRITDRLISDSLKRSAAPFARKLHSDTRTRLHLSSGPLMLCRTGNRTVQSGIGQMPSLKAFPAEQALRPLSCFDVYSGTWRNEFLTFFGAPLYSGAVR